MSSDTVSKDIGPSSSGGASKTICRIVIQQCLQASLKFDTPDPPVSIGPGMVAFVCFLQGATLDHINSIVKSVVNVKLCEPSLISSTDGSSSEPRRKSVLDCNHDILVIPQATLGGKLKGTGVQYHGLVSKDLGQDIYHAFVGAVKELQTTKGWTGQLACGVYGARQILQMDTNGPFTHILEF